MSEFERQGSHRQGAEHLTVRQLVVAVACLAAVAGLVAIDRRPGGAAEGDPLLEGVTAVEPVSDTAAAPPDEAPLPFVPSVSPLSTAWFCPGVPGDDPRTKGTIVIGNPTDSDLAATVTRVTPDVAATVVSVVVPARSTLDVDAVGGIKTPFVANVVEISGPAGSVEQVTNHPAGVATVPCANRTSSEWYFADGFTSVDSIDDVVVVNPFADASVVDVEFVTRDSGRRPSNLQGLVVGPRSLVVLDMAEQGARNEPILAVSIRASAGRVVAGRSQHYLGEGRLGYAMRLGSPGLASEWWLPDGERGEGISEEIVIYNPGDDERTVNIAFVNGQAIGEPFVLAAPAGRVTVVDTDVVPELPGRYAVNVSLSDGSDEPGVVVEHVVTRRVDGRTGTSVVAGAPGASSSSVWTAPSGLTAGLPDALLVLNVTPLEASFQVEQVGPAGSVALGGLESVALPPGALVVVAAPAGLPAGEVVVRATQPVVVQRLLTRGDGMPGRAAALMLPYLPTPSAAAP